MIQETPFERLRMTREHLLLSEEWLARRLDLGLASFFRWATAGIPSEYRGKLELLDAGAVEWIFTGKQPPLWRIQIVLEEDRGEAAWVTLAPSVIYHAWLDVLRGRLVRALRNEDLDLPRPPTLRVPRRRFLIDPFGSWTDRLTIDELTELAEHLDCWPSFTLVQEAIVQQHPACASTTSKVVSHPDDYDALLQHLEALQVRCRSARSDAPRWRQVQQEIAELVMPAQYVTTSSPADEHVEEPELSGAVIVPVLGSTLRTAWMAELLGSQEQELKTTITTLLAVNFSGRSFKMSDFAAAVERRTGLKVGAEDQDLTISSDTLLRHLKAIADEQGSSLSKAERTWTMA